MVNTIKTNYITKLGETDIFVQYGQVNHHGHLHGLARIILLSGNIWEGQFINGKPHGLMIKINVADEYCIQFYDIDKVHHGYCSHHDANNRDLIKELIYENDMFIGILTNPNVDEG